MATYPHMCRDGHTEIGHSESEHEDCPLCRALSLLETLQHAALGAAEWMAEHGNENGAAYLQSTVQLSQSLASEVRR